LRKGKEDEMEAQSKKPVLTAPNQGEKFLLVGAELVTFKLRGADYTICENATQGGYRGPPPIDTYVRIRDSTS
jgi:hypothetical protein